MTEASAAKLARAPVRLVSSTEKPAAEALVRALVKGERWATDYAWEEHSPMVFRLIERTLGPGGEAEDVAQEVFLRVYSRVHTLQEPSALGSFIYSVTVRMLKWHLRRRRVRRFLTLSASGELPAQPVPGADAAGRQVLKRFYALLDQLSSEQRVFFVLRHIEGLTVKELAAATDVSPATAKRRLGQAAKRVSALVDQDSCFAEYLKRSGASQVDES